MAVQAGGRRRFTRHFIIYVREPGAADAARVGITASRKVGNAVVRNRWKRMVREAFRELRVRLPVIDVVVICRPGNRPPTLDETRRQLFGGIRGARRA